MDDKPQYAPIIKFTAKDGKGYMLRSNDFRELKKTIGDRVNVYYNPDNPSDAIENPQSQLLFKMFLMIFVLVILIMINIGVIYKIVE